jgi:hypothetical protein
MRLAPLVLLLACSKPPPPRPPVTEQPADKVADIAGRWSASDDMDWGYTMTIEPSGVIDVWIDRGKQGRCEQKGTIAPGAASRVFRVTYTRGECNPEAVNVPIDMTIASFTGGSMTVVVADQRRTYTRSQ